MRMHKDTGAGDGAKIRLGDNQLGPMQYMGPIDGWVQCRFLG